MEQTTKLPCDLIEDGILVVDPTMKVVFANETLLKRSGLTGADVRGIPCHVAFRDSLLPCNGRCPHREIFSSGRSFSTTVVHTSQEGEETIFEVNATAVFDERGEIAQMVEILKKVSDRPKNENGARDQRDILRAVLDVFSGEVIIVNRDMRVVMANKNVLVQGNRTIENVTGKPCYEVFRRSSRPCSQAGEGCPAEDTFRTGLPSEAIHTSVDEKGDEHYLVLKTYPMKNRDGEVVQVVETLYDITEKAENEIKERIRLLEMKEELETLREELHRDARSHSMSPTTH